MPKLVSGNDEKLLQIEQKLKELYADVQSLDLFDLRCAQRISPLFWLVFDAMRIAAAQDVQRRFKGGKIDAAKHVQHRFEEGEKKASELLEFIDSNMLVQELQFAVDCLPYIQRTVAEHGPRWSELSFLDVGPRFGYGAKLMAMLHKGISLGFKLNVESIDLFDNWAAYSAICCPEANLRIGDIADVKNKYDIVY